MTDDVLIGSHVTIPDLKVLLDKVMSKNIFIGKTLGTDDTLAPVRAMQTRVKRVRLRSASVEVMALALRTFDGKGRCEVVGSMGSWRLRDSIEIHCGTENIRRWVLVYGPVVEIERRQ